MTTSDKPLPDNVVKSLEEAPESPRALGGPDLVPVYAYRPDGVKYAIQMSPADAERDGFELVNPPEPLPEIKAEDPPKDEPKDEPEPEPKAKKPKDKSRTKDTAKDKSKTPAKDKTPKAGSE